MIKQSSEYAYVEAKPKTGRMHQLRAHFKAIHHPIVADPLYAPNHPKALGFERLALHSRSIEFSDVTGQKQGVEAPLPADFLRAEEQI